MNYNITGRTLLLGDIHGSFNSLSYALQEMKTEENIENLILLGDVGLGFRSALENIYRLNIQANKYGVKVYFLRGNHDNPYYFNKLFNLSNIIYLEDFDTITYEGFKFLVVGGGVSVDRLYRAEGINFWKDEMPKPINDFYEENIFGILAHSNFVIPKGCGKEKIKGFLENDKTLEKDLLKEKEILKEYADKFKPKYWINGHYHVHDIVKIEDEPTIHIFLGNIYLHLDIYSRGGFRFNTTILLDDVINENIPEFTEKDYREGVL